MLEFLFNEVADLGLRVHFTGSPYGSMGPTSAFILCQNLGDLLAEE